MDSDPAFGDIFGHEAIANMVSISRQNDDCQADAQKFTHRATHRQIGEKSIGHLSHGNSPLQATSLHRSNFLETPNLSHPRQAPRTMGDFTYGNATHLAGSPFHPTSFRSQQQEGSALGSRGVPISHGDETHQVHFNSHLARIGSFLKDDARVEGSMGTFPRGNMNYQGGNFYHATPTRSHFGRHIEHPLGQISHSMKSTIKTPLFALHSQTETAFSPNIARKKARFLSHRPMTESYGRTYSTEYQLPASNIEISSEASIQMVSHQKDYERFTSYLTNDFGTIEMGLSHLNINSSDFVPRQGVLRAPAPAHTQPLQCFENKGPSSDLHHSDVTSTGVSASWNDAASTHRGYGVFQTPASSQFLDADWRYPVEDYIGPITTEGIEDHFRKRLPFAPSRYVLEAQRKSQAPNNTTEQSSSINTRDFFPFGEARNVSGAYSTVATEVTETIVNSSDYKDKIPRLAYKGDLDLEAEWLPESLNCKLFVTGVHPSASRKEIFDAIKDGKVHTFSYNPATLPRFRTAAFSISFANRESSDRFKNRADGEGVYIKGLRIKVVRDRTKMPALEEYEHMQTRVVRIYGSPGTLSLARIVHVLRKFIKFELVHGTENTIDGGRRSVVTLHFESIVGQSRAAVKCLMNLAKNEGLENQIRTRYQPDPCDPFPGFLDRDRLDIPE